VDQKEYKREYGRKRYAERKKAGLCVQCGKVKPTEGHTYCAKCGEEARKQSAYTFHRRRLLGVCVRCGKPKENENISFCDACAEEVRRRTVEWRARRRVANG